MRWGGGVFESSTAPLPQPIRVGPGLTALAVHAVLIAFVVWRSSLPSSAEADKAPTVVLYRAAPAKALPPPPAPRSSARPVTHKPTVQKKPESVVPRSVPTKPPEPAAPSPVEAAVPSSQLESGTAGGVVGGVVGGAVGGVVGATLKPKNVPAFVVQRDMLQQTQPNLPEVFKQAHRGQAMAGMYRVCVGTDGHVFEVGIVKSVPGADEAIVSCVRESWLYKPQAVPVCFLYNMPITVQ